MHYRKMSIYSGMSDAMITFIIGMEINGLTQIHTKMQDNNIGGSVYDTDSPDNTWSE